MKMKKYLMTGIAALALCAGFTSCSHDLDVPSPEKMKEMEAQKIVNNYEKAFKAYVGGNIAANQTWGFGSLASARTRAGEDPVQANANQWGDPNYYDGGYKIPDALTEGQKLRAAAYFKAHDHIDFVAPTYTDFFVQQVYKGDKQYQMGANTKVTGSNNMDKLTFGDTDDATHVHKFNAGTFTGDRSYNGLSVIEVLNTGANTNDCGKSDKADQWHYDQIQFLIGGSAASVGYNGSAASFHHYTGRCALVSAETIDTWAEDEANFVDGKAIGEKCKDDWDRSFVGLDFDGLSLEEAQKVNNGSRVEAKLSYAESKKKDYVWTGTTLVAWDAIKDEVLTDKDGNTVYFLTSSDNAIIGEWASLGSDPIKKMSKEECANYGVTITNSDMDVFDLTKIKDMIKDGYSPKWNGNLVDWVKYIGRDYYYDDWIVTLTKAEKQNTTITDPTTWSIRVMAEDLSASEESDFDFNDVVLDFFGTENSNILNVTLQAAGGTLPLRINEDNALEVHKLFKVETNVMVNTNWTGSNKADKSAVPFTITLASALTTEQGFLDAVKAIKLEVEKTVSDGTGDAKQWLPMNADQGKAAAKFAVPIYDSEGNEVRWANERESLKKKYGLFSTWATTAPHIQWWNPSLSGDE